MNALAWIKEHPELVWWIAGVTVLSFVVTLAAIIVVVVRMPPDYFQHRVPPPESFRGRHPAVRTAARVLKNLAGVLLIVAGLVLSIPLIPGQGILTMFIGLTLLEFPGKRALELRLARQRPVLRALNWIRNTAGRPPLVLAPRPEPPG